MTKTQHATLRQAAATLRRRYPGEAARLDRGLLLALNEAVTLHADGSASVCSGSDAEVTYQVREGKCDCPDRERAVDFRCKHAIAVLLMQML